ncbi:MAG: hypothetical protein GX601_18005 [Anaerolineales bacterium]|nr:hypothetical protein [Anaerolineales bacterium]
MLLDPSLLHIGFVNPPGGTHTSRTMMLAELRLLFAACPAGATLADYSAGVLEDNALRKETQSNRHRSLRSLRELYALDTNVTLFRVLRELWDADTSAQPLLALLCAVARDPLLRASAPAVLESAPATPISAAVLATAVARSFPDYSPAVLAKIGRNAASSWTQSGHLSGRTNKVRAAAQNATTATAYALFLGYLCGARGESLFETLWCRLLDAPAHLLHSQAALGSRQGWLEYRHSGMVTDITFRHLSREEDR